MKTLLMIAVLSCSLANAQTAKVVELPKHDAEQAKQLYEAKVAADKAWDDFNSKLLATYKSFTGIEFTDDFRFIVPKAWISSATTQTCWPTILTPGQPTTSNPATLWMNPVSGVN